MSKKKWIIIVASILVVVAIGTGLGLWIGMSNKNNVRFKEYKYRQYFRYLDLYKGEYYKIFVLVNSLDELKELCNEYNNPTYREEDDNYINSKDLCDKLREYDDTFFVDKALIIYTDVANCGHTSYSIKKMYIENEELIVDIKVTIWQGMAIEVVTPWTLLIEVNKEDIAEAKDIKYIKENYYEKEK